MSTACALGVFGTQLGTAIGFLVPPLLVQNSDLQSVRLGFQYLVYGVAIIATASALSVILCKLTDHFDGSPFQ